MDNIIFLYDFIVKDRGREGKIEEKEFFWGKDNIFYVLYIDVVFFFLEFIGIVCSIFI